MNINERIYRNVKALSKICGKNLKDIENEIGRTTGYLSRKNTKIDVETLIKLSEIFGVTNDELMNGDFEYELNRKVTMENLRVAVLAMRDFFAEDSAIVNFVTATLDADSDASGEVSG